MKKNRTRDTNGVLGEAHQVGGSLTKILSCLVRSSVIFISLYKGIQINDSFFLGEAIFIEKMYSCRNLFLRLLTTMWTTMDQ